jgi:O-methyltransferase domain/Dimerisation domain
VTAPANQQDTVSAQMQMLQIIASFWISRAVYVIAKLGIPDLLKAAPRTASELAESTNTHASSLYRVMRALASVGIVRSEKDNRFALTPVSETLVTDAPGSLRWFAVSELGQEHYPAWGNLMHSVKTGDIAFDHFFGTDIWTYFQKNPEDAAVFNDSMSAVTAVANEEILSLYDFSGFKKLVDIGGGHGGLITSILKAHPNLKGVLFDAPEVVTVALKKIEAAGLADRCEAVAGDFFKSVPAGADAYLLKWIIHDWDDERSIRIFNNCRSQIAPNGRLILVDCVVPDADEPHFSKFIDLNMLVMTGGKERTTQEFRELLAASGFTLLRVVPTKVPTSIIEAEPA